MVLELWEVIGHHKFVVMLSSALPGSKLTIGEVRPFEEQTSSFSSVAINGLLR
jgi:hypothetical protein